MTGRILVVLSEQRRSMWKLIYQNEDSFDLTGKMKWTIANYGIYDKNRASTVDECLLMIGR